MFCFAATIIRMRHGPCLILPADVIFHQVHSTNVIEDSSISCNFLGVGQINGFSRTLPSKQSVMIAMSSKMVDYE